MKESEGLTLASSFWLFAEKLISTRPFFKNLGSRLATVAKRKVSKLSFDMQTRDPYSSRLEFSHRTNYQSKHKNYLL